MKGLTSLATSLAKSLAKRLKEISVGIWHSFIVYYILFYYDVCNAAEDITSLLNKTRDLLVFAVNVLGPGIGAVLILIGALKIRRKEDDPRQASQAVWYIVAGVIAALASIVLKLFLEYYIRGGITGSESQIGSPRY